jgi:chromosomal replication initiation ATPase DnaA
MNDHIAVPLDAVLDIVGGLCSDCNSVVRLRLAAHQFDRRQGIEERMGIIMERVYQETGVTILAMRRKDNRRRIVAARRKVAVLARSQQISYPKIGAALQKHHTTIMHLVETA